MAIRRQNPPKAHPTISETVELRRSALIVAGQCCAWRQNSTPADHANDVVAMAERFMQFLIAGDGARR